MSRNDVDVEILEIEAHAWRTWLESGDAVICRRCGNPFVPSGRRRGRDTEESGAGGEGPVQDAHEAVTGDHEMGRESHETVMQHHNAVDLCGSCVPLRFLEYGDHSVRHPECERCGQEIRGRRGDSKYCSDSCKTLACRERRSGNAEAMQGGDNPAQEGEHIGIRAIRKQDGLEEGSAT